ncbi:MAG TPA: LPS export ABC transporter periplasmic protein LptC [Xanthomonadales bacterium]|nr:LPS export ABC transporter periplasmic protein LptC [Xanthomonadales bacterium]
MIRRKTSAGIMVLAVLVVLSYWIGGSKTDRRAPAIAGLDTRLDYALRDFELRYFDLEGRPSGRLTAPVLTNHAATGIGEIAQPVFDVIHRDKVWNIVAESASVGVERERVVLLGEVRMQREGLASGGRLEVHTSEMVLELAQRLASSDQWVRIEDGDDTLEAVGFQVNLANDHFNLRDQVQLRYAVN